MPDDINVYRLTWRGIEIEARYEPLKWSVIAHLEVESIKPERVSLPISLTGYKSDFHQPGTIEAHGGNVVEQVIAWLDEEAESREWKDHLEASRQGDLFACSQPEAET